MKNVLIVLIVTLVCFWVGGGYHLVNTPIEDIIHPHRAQGDDLSSDISTWIVMFVFEGGAAGLAGAVVSSVALFLMAKRKKAANPNREP